MNSQALIPSNKNIEIQLQKNGQDYIKSYPFLEDVGRFMEHPLCREFYEKYMKNSETLSQMLDLLFYYEHIDKNDYIGLNGYQKIGLLMEIIIRKDKENDSEQNLLH